MLLLMSRQKRSKSLRIDLQIKSKHLQRERYWACIDFLSKISKLKLDHVSKNGNLESKGKVMCFNLQKFFRESLE
jgi:hypothetical protein